MFPIDIDVLGLFQLGSDFTLKYFILQNELLKWLTCDFFFFSSDSMEVKPVMTRKLRRRPNDPLPLPEKRRKPSPDILSYLTTS